MATKMSDKVKGELITRIMVEMKSAALEVSIPVKSFIITRFKSTRF